MLASEKLYNSSLKKLESTLISLRQYLEKKGDAIKRHDLLYNLLFDARNILHGSNLLLEDLELATKNKNYTAEALFNVLPLFVTYINYINKYGQILNSLDEIVTDETSLQMCNFTSDEHICLIYCVLAPVRRIPQYALDISCYIDTCTNMDIFEYSVKVSQHLALLENYMDKKAA